MPDATLRFAVGDAAGLSSNSWRVWTRPDGDVYIACRDNYKELKVSLHGHRWRVGATDVGAKATSHLRAEDADRAWMVWDRPEPVDGITIGYRIAFLTSELAVGPEARDARKWRGVEFFPAAAELGVTVALVTINEPGRRLAIIGLDGETFVEQEHRFLPLAGGGEVQLILHEDSLGEPWLSTLVAGYGEARALTEAAAVEVPAAGRMFLVGTHLGGHFATEVNYHRPDPDPLNATA